MKSLTDPTNRDTELAMVTKGEFVSPKETMEIYGPTLAAQRNHGLALRAARNKAFLEGKPIPKIVPPPPEITAMNSGGIMLSDEDKDLLIRMAAAEARGEDLTSQAGVMYVALNRQKANREEHGGDKLHDIIKKKHAFTSTLDPTNSYWYDKKNTDIKTSAEYKKAASILEGILSGEIKDPTNGAEFFLNEELTRQQRKDGKLPGWYDNVKAKKRLGKHTFAQHPDYVEKVTKSIVPSVRGAQNRIIPEYNPGGFVGGLPMEEEEEDPIMNFMKNHQGRLGDVNPEDVAAGIISDEYLLQNSSDSGANSFREANQMQYGDPRQSISMPGAFMGNMTDAQSLRGGNIRPDMMPPGYVPPKPEVIQRTTSPQGGADRIAFNNITSNLDLQVPRSGGLMNAVVPPANAGVGDWIENWKAEVAKYKAIMNNPDMYNRMSPAEKELMISKRKELENKIGESNRAKLTQIPYMDMANPTNRKMYPAADGYDLNNEMPLQSSSEYTPLYQNMFMHGGDGTTGFERDAAIVKNNPLGIFTPENEKAYAEKALEIAQDQLENLDGETTLNPFSANFDFRLLPNPGEVIEERANRALEAKNKALADIAVADEKIKAKNEEEARKDVDRINRRIQSLENAKLNTNSPEAKAALDKEINKQKSLLNDLNDEFNFDDDKKGDDTPTDPYAGTQVDKIVAELAKKNGGRFPANLEDAAAKGKLEDAGRRVNPKSKTWEKAKSFLKDLFGDIFNKKDLGKAIAIYLGARIFGASPNQAGAMAGKYYLARQDKHEANVAAYMKAGKHKPSSIAKFAKTRNLNDLELIGTLVSPTNTYETFYKRLRNGKEIKVMARKYKIGEDGSGWKIQIDDPDNPGKRIWVAFDPTQGFTTDGSRFRSGGDEYTKEVARLQKLGATLVKPELSILDDKGVEKRIFENFNEQKAGVQWGAWLIDNNIPADTGTEMLNMAVTMMKQEKKRDPKKKAGYGSIKPYLDKTFVIVKTEGTGVSGVAFKNADGEYIPATDLDRAISNVRATAIKANPEIANYNPVMVDTMIVKNAGINYQAYLDRILKNKPTDMSDIDFLNENDDFRIRAQNMDPQTTPLYEFMRAGGINAT
jgi:hypothetical protein